MAYRLAALLCLRLLWAPSAEACLPREETSVDGVLERIVLNEVQEQWLRESLSAGRVQHPEDLWRCPQAGSGLVTLLEAAFCWDRRRTTVQTETLAGSPPRHLEQRVLVQSGKQWGVFRFKKRESKRLFVGGVALHAGSFQFLGGSLRGRQGLGLLIATPGTESRGHEPERFVSENWKLSASEGSIPGIHADYSQSQYHSWFTALSIEDQVSLQGGVRVTGTANRVGVSFWGTPDNRGASLTWRRPEPGVSLEVATFRDLGWSWGSVWSLHRSRWRFRGSAVHRVNPTHSHRNDVRWEATYRAPQARLRGALGLRKRFDGDAPYRRDAELEARINLATGWSLTSLWRRSEVTDLTPAGEVQRVFRYSLEWRRAPWWMLVRWEDHSTDNGETTLATLRFRRAWKPGALEFRARDRRSRGRDPGVTAYRRRPGNLSDLERVPLGIEWGLWTQGEWGPTRLELSGDVWTEGWEGALAVRFYWEVVD